MKELKIENTSIKVEGTESRMVNIGVGKTWNLFVCLRWHGSDHELNAVPKIF